MKKSILLIMTLLSVNLVSTLAFNLHDGDMHIPIKIDQLYYTLDTTNNTATVTFEYLQSPENYLGLTNIIIPDSVKFNERYFNVTAIGNGAFAHCVNLKVVVISDHINSIGNNAFLECSNLISITIPDNVTAIGNLAFTGCSRLTTPLYNKHIFAYMPETYSGAYIIPDGIKIIAGGAFLGCSRLTSVVIPNTTTEIKYAAFNNCTALESIQVPNSVRYTEELCFAGCNSLKSPVYNENIFFYMPTSYSGAYAIPKGIKEIAGAAFFQCDKLTCVILPNSIKSIGQQAFQGCSSLKYITIPNSVTTIGDFAFYDCKNLQPITSRKYMKELDDNIFYDAIRNIPYLVVCFYDFNRPSQTVIPVLDQLSQEYFSKLMVGLYDVYGGSENSSVVSEYNITALPTLLFFKGGKLVNRHIGICSAEYLRVLFNELLKS